MSNNQDPPTRGRIQPTSGRARPHFRLIRPVVDSAHEEAVINAGYPWVRTNALIPTWMSPDPDTRPKPSPNPVPDRLNLHGHHGINTHLIVEGDLTLIKPKKMFDQNHVTAVTLSADVGGAKELSVAPDEVYFGTTQQACRFVEGHRSLSPTSAHRYMHRGSLEWVDKTGRAVRDKDQAYVLKQLGSADFKTNFDFKQMRRVATSCEFKDDNQVTRSMRQWFLREWNDPDVQAGKGDLRPAIHPLDPPPAPLHQDHQTGVDDDEADSLGDEMDSDDGDGSAGLTKTFGEWLLGGLPDN